MLLKVGNFFLSILLTVVGRNSLPEFDRSLITSVFNYEDKSVADMPMGGRDWRCVKAFYN
jgi:hypothetical protein